MLTSPKHEKSFFFLKVILCLFLFLIALVSAFSTYQQGKTLTLQRLVLLNDLAAETVKTPLQQGELADVQKKLEGIQQHHRLASISLYGVDGLALAAHGPEEKQPLETLTYGEHISWQWPFTLYFQYSSIVFQNDRPLGFLIVSAFGDTGLLIWPTFFILLSLVVIFIVWRLNDPLVSERGSLFASQSQDSLSPPELLTLAESEEKIREATEELRGERDRATASAEAKSEFLASMSHEIRSSLNGIIGVLALLQRSKLDDEQLHLVRAADLSADSLLLIINDVLDFAKIESGKIEFAKVDFNLRETIEDCIALFIESARVKSIAVHCYVPTNIVSRIKGDPVRLRQIITNLMSNGVKFTEQGEVNLFVSTVTRDSFKQRLCFTIEDTGIGIKPARIDDIFEMYVQADAQIAKEYGGTGVGLSICKKLVELQGGKIGVESTPGLGTSFWFTLEFDLVEENVFPPQLSLQNKKVIQLSNCETCATIISQYLYDAQIHNISASSIKEIKAQLEVDLSNIHDAEIVLIDYESFTDDLEELMDVMEAKLGFDSTRVFVMHWSGESSIIDLKSRITGFISKPVSFLPFRKMLCGMTPMLSEKDSKDEEYLSGRVLLVDDEEINRHVGQRILQKIGCTADIAPSGERAVAMAASIAYDIILMDIQMPEMSGIEATRIMRAKEEEEALRKTVIIALTANGLPSTKERCLAAGMDGFVVKPIHPEKLKKILAQWLPVSRSAEKQQDENYHLQSGQVFQAEEQIWNRNRALRYLGGDEELLVELMKMFLKKKEILLTKIQKAMNDTDGEEISCAAHAFKGAVNHFAAERCRKLAQTIESKAAEGQIEGLDNYYKELVAAADTLEEELKQEI
ncbi:MAG: ATP-binding protein [Desulfocapsaceae bacterium]|nr:ATP-binding protein [Desulfocapsaceae bacterium]